MLGYENCDVALCTKDNQYCNGFGTTGINWEFYCWWTTSCMWFISSYAYIFGNSVVVHHNICSLSYCFPLVGICNGGSHEEEEKKTEKNLAFVSLKLRWCAFIIFSGIAYSVLFNFALESPIMFLFHNDNYFCDDCICDFLEHGAKGIAEVRW